GMVNGVLRSIQRQGLPKVEQMKDEVERLALEVSFPTWLVKRWIDQYGIEATREMCQVSLLPPDVTVRVNIQKTTVDDAIIRLSEEGVTANKGVLSPDALVITKGNVFLTETYKQGFLTVQD